MKKTLSKVLVVAMLLSLVFCFASCGSSSDKGDKYIGTWQATNVKYADETFTMEEMGMTFEITITKDGKVTAKSNGEEDGSGAWKVRSGKLVISDESDEDIVGVIKDGNLQLQFGDLDMVFIMKKV